jgi:spermidine synthase
MKRCGPTLRRRALLSMRLLAGLLGLVCGSTQAQVLHTEKSLYRDIIVYQEDGLRCMRFGRHAASRQTCVTLAEPDKLVFDYTKMMMAALYLNPSPKRVLILGLGGGTLPNTLRRLFPEARIDVAEIDPAVVRVAKQFFNFKESDRLRVSAEDGRVFVKRARSRPDRYDLVMLDAFDHEYIPEHLLTREFFQEVRNIMTERGVLAANTFSGSRLYHYESATYYSVFGDFYRLKKGNRVILARLGGLPDRNELWRNADAVEARLLPLGTDRATLMSLVEIEKGWPADTRILTDQFSPSNLLNAK